MSSRSVSPTIPQRAGPAPDAFHGSVARILRRRWRHEAQVGLFQARRALPLGLGEQRQEARRLLAREAALLSAGSR